MPVTPDELRRIAETYPHLLSPLTLMRFDRPSECDITPHIKLLNSTFIDLIGGKHELCIVNAPFRSGKSQLLTIFGVAWYLLWHPDRRVVIAAYAEKLAREFGGHIRDVVRRYGAQLGVTIRGDADSIMNWKIKGTRGEFRAASRGAPPQGFGFHLCVIDDLLEDGTEAMSAAIGEQNWNFFITGFMSRRDPGAKVLINNVRWSKTDLTARILEKSKVTGEKWHHVKIRAVAEADDELGRKPGELLWTPGTPMHAQTVKNLLTRRNERWFEPNDQQRAFDQDGKLFKPTTWPKYEDHTDTYVLTEPGAVRVIVPKCDLFIMVMVDWAWSEKATSDYSAIGVFGVTPQSKLLVLEVTNERLGLHLLAPAIARVCDRWGPHLVGIEVGHPSLRQDCERYAEIPEVRWIDRKGQLKSKLMRALPAVIAGENKRIFLPHPAPAWLESYQTQLASFEGMEDDHDDMVDVTSDAADQQRVLMPEQQGSLPDLLVPGREMMW